MKWLKKTLADGFSMLILLKLKNAPREEEIQPTLEAWYRTITYKRAYEQELDQQRFVSAFMTLAQGSEWFPTPRELLAAMPARKMPKIVEIEYKTDPQVAARNIKKLREILRGAYVNVKP